MESKVESKGKKFSWLHFTDMHAVVEKHDQDSLLDWTRDLAPFTESIKDTMNKAGLDSIDCIFFTGDLTNRGTKKEFKQFNTFLTKITEELNPGTQAPILCMVPGNHDLNREIKDSIKNNLTRSDDFSKNKAYILKSDIKFKRDKEDTFSELNIAFKQYVDYTNYENETTFVTGLLPGDFYKCIDVSNGSNKIGVFGLNSAFRHVDDIKEGGISLFYQQLETLARNAENITFIELSMKNQVNILLTHHPYSWYCKETKDLFDDTIKKYFSFNFCGHVHESALQLDAFTDGMITFQGRAMSTHVEYECAGQKYTRIEKGYTLGIFDFQANAESNITFYPVYKDNHNYYSEDSRFRKFITIQQQNGSYKTKIPRFNKNPQSVVPGHSINPQKASDDPASDSELGQIIQQQLFYTDAPWIDCSLPTADERQNFIDDIEKLDTIDSLIKLIDFYHKYKDSGVSITIRDLDFLWKRLEMVVLNLLSKNMDFVNWDSNDLECTKNIIKHICENPASFEIIHAKNQNRSPEFQSINGQLFGKSDLSPGTINSTPDGTQQIRISLSGESEKQNFYVNLYYKLLQNIASIELSTGKLGERLDSDQMQALKDTIKRKSRLYYMTFQRDLAEVVMLESLHQDLDIPIVILRKTGEKDHENDSYIVLEKLLINTIIDFYNLRPVGVTSAP